MAEIEKKGIKETTEVIQAVPAFIAAAKEAFQDGAQITDALAIGSAVMAESFQKAMDNVGDVPAELKDLDIKEYRALSHISTDAFFDTLEVFTKQKA